MYGTLQMFLSDISTKQDQFENVDSCCAPKSHLWSENPFSRTEGTVDWEARLWQGALSISRPVSSSLRSGLMTLAQGLNSSRKALTIAVPPSVACKFQKPLLKVSDYPLSLVVCRRCEPQQWFHCWLLWWDRERSPPDSVFASGSSVQHGLPLCLQHEAGELWDGGWLLRCWDWHHFWPFWGSL